MTGAEFRAKLEALGETQVTFGKALEAWGHGGRLDSIARKVRRWATTGPAPEATVILAMMEAIQKAKPKRRKRAAA